jgi:exodeoxyribonuclease V beta subunit
MTERHFFPLASPFEVELSGTRLLEAGAGTGKTWTIAALVLRLLLERKLEIGQILVVTYTRAASGELRGRIRARLTEALAAFETGVAEEPYLRQLVLRHEAREAQARLRLAIESFDAAAIFTIHGFCQRALGETAFAAGQPFDRELIADQGELVAAVARDAWRRTLANASSNWAKWLVEHVQGPDGLARRVRSHLGRIDARLVAPDDSDRQLAEQRFAAVLETVRSHWRADARAILDWLAGARLHQGSYGPKKMQPRCVAFERWLTADPVLLPLPKDSDHFGLAKLTQKLNQGGQLPTHPFFAAVDDLLAATAQLEQAYDSEERRLVQDFLTTARNELAERKRRTGQRTYDDLLVDLAQALDGPAGAKLAADLRARYRIALVDEFQDTDPLQLKIFLRVFTAALVFVGDPKQAIYGFRGADVFAYLAARARADSGYALLDNRRSDAALLAAVNALFERPQPFLIEGMAYEPARAATLEPKACRIDDDAAPLTLWTMSPPADARSFTKEAAQTMAAEAVAADIARLLRLSATGGASLGDRPLIGGDIAVLVRRHREGDAVRAALARHGIACVSGGGGSVWHSEEAEDLERLLLAVAAPTREGLVRAALVTVLLGADAAQLAAWAADDAAWSARLDCFHDDLVLLRERGFMAMWRRLLRREGVVTRLLARPDGERRLTNYRHLAELLQAAEQATALDVEGLVRHIARQREAPEGEDNQLRLESDAQLVRIVTLHAAKGLQYPVVYCPFLWHGPEERKDWPVFAHDDGQCLDFGSARIDALRNAAAREAAAEELRLAYVALTRAEHRCIVAWGPVNNFARSPLAWLLFGPRAAVEGDPLSWLADWLKSCDEATLTGELQLLANRLAGALKLLPLPGDGAAPVVSTAVEHDLSPRIFTGRIPAPWRVQSFSSLAAQLDEEAESADRDAVTITSAVSQVLTFASIHAFPRGTRAGSCLHALFERIDFQQRAPVGPVAAAVLAEFGYPPEWRPVLDRLVADVLSTPLNAAGLCLNEIARGERLIELEFAFPLGSVAERAGYMKGFIDLVFRHAGRWYIVDWKSNALDDYGPESLAAAMCQHRYDLQLRIYAAALQRALACREPATDWEQSFGGVFYLFLRGMVPGSTAGIHFSRPTLDEIAEFLS